MRVSVYSTGSPDYLVDIVADGLIRLLGRDNVHLRYNRTSTDDTTKSQLFHGFSTPNKIDFLDTDILVASTRSKHEDIAAWVRETRGRAVAILDGEDDVVVRQSHYAVATLYFKRECLLSVNRLDRVRPLPFAAIPEAIPEPPMRDIRVSFAARYTSPIRGDILRTLQTMGVQPDAALRSKKEYNSILARSMIGVSARGIGWDTYRYWETAYFGCALLSQRLQIVIPGNFVDNTEAIFFDGMGDFRKKLDALLGDPARALALGKSVRNACVDRHLSIHRAKTVLESVL